MNDKYVLCFKGINSKGKEEIFKIFESSLNNIDMYTCYKSCCSSKNLYDLLPREIHDYIETFNHNYDFEGNFFIRKSCKDINRGRTDLPILFKSDADIVYAKKDHVHEALLSMTSSEDDTEEISKIKKDFFSKLCDIFEKEKAKDIFYKLDDEIELKGTFYKTRADAMFRMPSFQRKIKEYISEDYVLKRKVLTLLKTNKKKIDDINNEKTRLVNEHDLRELEKNRPGFSFLNNMRENLNKKRESENKKEDDASLEKKDETKASANEISTQTKTCEDKNESNVNFDYINYVMLLEEKNKQNKEDDFEDDELDDFLGPRKPNDPRYWSIN